MTAEPAPRWGSPRFKARHRDRKLWVRFHTGTMRLEPDRRHLILPAIAWLRAWRTRGAWSGWSPRAGHGLCR